MSEVNQKAEPKKPEAAKPAVTESPKPSEPPKAAEAPKPAPAPKALNPFEVLARAKDLVPGRYHGALDEVFKAGQAAQKAAK